MFFLPPDTKEAVWMQAPDSNPYGFKWWIAALSDTQLFTLWGKGQLEQGKTIADNAFDANRKYAEKLEEKRGKGYRVIAGYGTGQAWKPETAMPVPAYPPMPRGKGAKDYDEGRILSLMLEDGGFYVSLELNEISGQPAGSQTCGLLRLDHYESRGAAASSMINYPLWQTRYDEEQEAVDAIRGIIDDRQGKGYNLMKVSGSTRLREAILNGTPLSPFVAALANDILAGITNDNAPDTWFW